MNYIVHVRERSFDIDYVFLLVSLIGRTYLWGTSRGGE